MAGLYRLEDRKPRAASTNFHEEPEFEPDGRKKTISMKPINHNQSELVTLYTAPVVPPSAA